MSDYKGEIQISCSGCWCSSKVDVDVLLKQYEELRAGDKGDLTKKFDQVCVWYRWKGYLSGSMKNGCWGVASGGIGHQRSFNVTTQGHLKKKCDLTKNFHKLCVS